MKEGAAGATVTEPDELRAQLARLARDETSEETRENVVRRAATAAEDVETAAAFAAGGGRERLATVVEADERDGNADRAARGRRVLASYDRFETACGRPAARPRSDDRTGTE